MSKNVAVFVDVANIFYAAKAAGVDIDYVTLLKSASAGRDLVRAYAYTGLDPDNENQRNFHSFLARHGYKVVSKDIRKYGDGKVKANLDIELVVDMMKTARNLDIAIVVSGDGDFAPAIRAVQEMGVRVEVISFRGNTSSDLIDVADLFTDIIHLAKVEKASSRSGRRVAGDDEDLSMTEVPDKQTEGTGARGRSRGGRGRGREAEPAARVARRAAEPAVAVTSSGAPLVILPGEKLSRVTPAAASIPVGKDVDLDVAGSDDGDEAFTAPQAPVAPAAGQPAGARGEVEGEAARRRRRRGGRGRGRGRGRGEGAETPVAIESRPAEPEAEEEFVEAPRAPRTNPFGSVWDSQLGVPSPAPSRLAPLPEEDDLDEPEIPEYLIAERKNQGRPGSTGGARGGRGGHRAAYAAAIDRERYGRGSSTGGINRYPDVSARERPRETGAARESGFPRRDRPVRQERPERQDRPERAAARSSGGGSEWSEVPPELEAILRAQVSSRPRSEAAPSTAPDERRTGAETPEPAGDRAGRDGRSASRGTEQPETSSARPEGTAAESEAPKRRTTRRASAASSTADAAGETATRKPRATRRPSAKAAAAGGATESTESTEEGAIAAPKRRTTRKTAAEAAPEGAAEAEAPKRRTTRPKASPETPTA